MNAADNYQFETSRRDLAAGILEQATLDLIPETVREEVLADMSVGALRYWSRRCGRAARRFKIFLSNIFIHERTTANAAEPVT